MAVAASALKAQVRECAGEYRRPRPYACGQVRGGDPLADVGYVLNNWAEPGESPPAAHGASLPPSAAEGFPTRAEFLDRYEELTGRDVTKMPYYRAFQYWRSGAIVEGVLDRYLQGKMAGEIDTDHYGKRVEELAEAALESIQAL